MENKNELVVSNVIDMEPDENGVHVATHDVFDDGDTNYTYNFGTLADFEKRLSESLYGLDDLGPDLSNHYIRMIRQSLHEANLITDIPLDKKEKIESHLALLDNFSSIVSEKASEFSQGLAAKGLDGFGPYNKAIENFIQSEHARFNRPKTEGSPSLGAIFKSFFTKDKIGVSVDKSVHAWKNEKLKASFASIDSTLSDIRSKIGDPVWEEKEGLVALKSINETMEDIENSFGDSTNDINDEIIKKKIAQTRESLKEVKGAASSQSFKALADQMIEAFTKFIDNLLKKIGLRSKEVDLSKYKDNVNNVVKDVEGEVEPGPEAPRPGFSI